MNRREFLKAGAAIAFGTVAGLRKVNASESTPERKSAGWDIDWNVGGWDIGKSPVTRIKIENKDYIPIVSSWEGEL